MSDIVRAPLSWWARRFRRVLRPPRRALPTLPGLFALGAPTFLGLAAVTSTNNLLFLLLGATLGSIVLSGILSERNIRPIEVRVRPAGPLYAGRPGPIEVRFRREEARFTAFDLRFREAPSVFSWPWKRRPTQPEVVDVHVGVLEGREAKVMAERRFARRGRARLPICEVCTRYPFGLLVKSKDVVPDIEVWVRPKVVPRPAALRRPPGVSGSGELSVVRGHGLDIYGLRERQEQDPLHRVHALRSLSLGRPVVLEMSGIERPMAELGVASDLDADPEALERALEIAQAALRSWDEEGFAVGLSTNSRRFAPGAAHLDVLLDHLADVEPAAATAGKTGPKVWLVPTGARPPSGAEGIPVGPAGLTEGAA